VLFPGFDDVLGIPGDWSLWDVAKAGTVAAVAGKAATTAAGAVADA